MSEQVRGSADVSLELTEGKIRYLRLQSLLVTGGTKVLRKLLQFIISPEELSEVLNKTPVKTRLHLNLFDHEWQLLYPPLGPFKPESLDITLIVKLLKQQVICGTNYIRPTADWNDLPNNTDLTLEANIRRIRYYRNFTSHINEKMEIQKPDFHDYWKQVKGAILGIVGHFSPHGSPLREEWEKGIDELLTCPLDAPREEGSSFCNQVFSLRCVIKLASVGAWLGGTLYVLNRLKDNQDVLANLVECVFPDGISVFRIDFGSIKLQLFARNLLATEELRKRYDSGQLKEDLEKFMVTEELTHLANEPVEFTVEIDEDEYLVARQYLYDNQETADDTLCKKEREEEDDNLKEDNVQETVSLKEEGDNLKEYNAQETVSLEEEDDNLKEINAQETVSLKEDDNLKEDNAQETVSLEEEDDNLKEYNAQETVSLKEEDDNLKEYNAQETVSLEEEDDNLKEYNAQETVSLKEEDDNLKEDNAEETVSLKEEDDNLKEINAQETVSLKEEDDNLKEDSAQETVSLEEEDDNLKEDSAQETVSLEEEDDNLKEINAQETVSLKEEDDNLKEYNAQETVSLEEEDDNLKEDNAQETVSLEEEDDNLKEYNAQETVSLKEEDDNLKEINAQETVSLKEEKDETTSEQETTTNTLTFGKPGGREY